MLAQRPAVGTRGAKFSECGIFAERRIGAIHLIGPTGPTVRKAVLLLGLTTGLYCSFNPANQPKTEKQVFIKILRLR